MKHISILPPFRGSSIRPRDPIPNFRLSFVTLLYSPSIIQQPTKPSLLTCYISALFALVIVVASCVYIQGTYMYVRVLNHFFALELVGVFLSKYPGG